MGLQITALKVGKDVWFECIFGWVWQPCIYFLWQQTHNIQKESSGQKQDTSSSKVRDNTQLEWTTQQV